MSAIRATAAFPMAAPPRRRRAAPPQRTTGDFEVQGGGMVCAPEPSADHEPGWEHGRKAKAAASSVDPPNGDQAREPDARSRGGAVRTSASARANRGRGGGWV